MNRISGVVSLSAALALAGAALPAGAASPGGPDSPRIVEAALESAGRPLPGLLWESEKRRARLVEALKEAAAHGLAPADPDLSKLAEWNAATGAEWRAKADRLLTEAAIRYSAALRQGRLDPAEVDESWQIERPGFDAAAFVRGLAEGDEQLAALDGLAPPYAGYHLLRHALARLREVAAAGGWPKMPGGPTLKPGMTDPRVVDLRRRLAASGDLAADAAPDNPTMDEAVVAAVQRFQARHGLAVDGAVGPNTLAALNVPAEARIAQILANMERWRWLPRQLESYHIAVNLPAATLEVVKDGAVAMEMRVIVGKPRTETVSFKATIGSVTVNPYWNVPYSIASQEILPDVKEDPGFLLANDMRIVGVFPPDSPEAAGIGIDWHAIPPGTIPFRIRQLPGPRNALGRLKFNMPNGHDIYMHDTPARQLFAKPRRDFSHGCVRLERPLELAALLTGRSVADLQALIDAGETKTVRLPKGIPAYLLYFTAWVAGDGTLHFREDLYGRDAKLIAALAPKKPPATKVAAEQP